MTTYKLLQLDKMQVHRLTFTSAALRGSSLHLRRHASYISVHLRSYIGVNLNATFLNKSHRSFVILTDLLCKNDVCQQFQISIT